MLYKFWLLALTLMKTVTMHDESLLDFQDLLNEDYMPGKLLLLENLPEKNILNSSIDERYIVNGGNKEDALQTMVFHRKMMNEYLCRNYISERILSSMSLVRTKRKLINPTELETSPETVSSLTKSLINDEGSKNYQEWLKRSATLEDIYRQFEHPINRKYDEPHTSEENRRHDVPSDEYNSGVHYSIQQPSLSHATPSSKVSYDGAYGYGTGQGGYIGSHPGGPYGSSPHHAGLDEGFGFEEHHYFPKNPLTNKKKEEIIALFNTALTAIAYLSFGMFLVHVLMCISGAGTSNNMTTIPVMPMSMGPTAGTSPTANNGNVDNGGENTGASGTATGGSGPVPGTNGGTATGGGGTATGGGGTATGGAGTATGGDGTSVGDGGTATGGDGTAPGGTATGTGGADNGGDEDTPTGNGGDGYTGTGVGGTAAEGGTEAGTGNSDIDVGGDIDENDTEAITLESGDGIRFRFKKSADGFHKRQLLNELARKVLISFDAALVAANDEGECLRKSLCENNKFSRDLDDNSKYWIPLWSFGMSWLSGRIIEDIPRSTSMLESLKASLLGLGKADCEFIYRNCNLRTAKRKLLKRK